MRKALAALAALALVTACAHQMSEHDVRIVMAKIVERGKGASGVTDVFNYEGEIYAYATFNWEPKTKHGGDQKIETVWFNGQKEMQRRSLNAVFGTPPHYVWMSTRGTALGPGDCRVEMYANGRFVGRKTFVVTDK